MAMTNCAECGNEVSTTAETCPKCGARVKPKAKIWRWVLGVPVGLFAAIMIIGSNVTPDPERQRLRNVYDTCRRDMTDPLRSASHREAARWMCEQVREEYRAKFRSDP